jgi:glycosyltransferase involved in cell wall biosynthesis
VLIASMMRPDGETGVQTHVRAVRDALARQGHRVVLVTPFDQPGWLVYPLFGIRRVVDKLSRPASVWWYRHWHAVLLERALRARLKSGGACVVYAQCPLSARAALRARVSGAQRVTMVVHFNLSQADEWADKGMIAHGGTYFRAIRSLEETVLPRLDALVYVSDFMRRALFQRMPALAGVSGEVIPNFLADPGVSTGRIPEFDLIAVGTLEPRKNQIYALAILEAAAHRGRKLTLTLVGDGPDRGMLETRVRDRGLGEQVRFLGFVPDAAARMSGHRACLHVARMENLPLALIEALSRGLPVFAPDAGGMAEVFEDGVSGRTIPLDDADGAARRILEWLDDPVRMSAAAEAARRRFLDRFEADQVARKLVGFLGAAV